MGKLTKAAMKWLRALAELHPDACLTMESIDRGYAQMPLFRARLKSVPCPTCGHPTKEQPVKWDVVAALAEHGSIAERISGSGYFYITPAARSTLSPGGSNGQG